MRQRGASTPCQGLSRRSLRVELRRSVPIARCHGAVGPNDGSASQYRHTHVVQPLAWPQALADADIGEVETVVAPLGCGPTRAARLVSMGAKLVDNFDGAIPDDLDSLVTLPGVGRKTANVVLGNAFGIPGITPDTHVMRVSRRLGWTDATTPAKVETDLAELFDPSEWVMLCHRLIWHGRRRCHSRRPACGVCPVAEWCPSFGEGPTDPEEAATLVREPRR